MASTKVTGASAWMTGSSSNLRLPSSIPFLEDDPNPRWRISTPSENQMPNEVSLVKEDLPPNLSFSHGLSDLPSSSYSKGVLDEEWYIAPGNTLIDDMKELNYAPPSLAAQSEPMIAPHFSLDSNHVHFLSRNAGRNFSSPDSRPILPLFMEGALPFDTSGNGLLSSFGPMSGIRGLNGNNILDNQIGIGNTVPLGNNPFVNNSNNPLPSNEFAPGIPGFSNLQPNNRGNSMLLSNISARSTMGDSFINHSGVNLSGILNCGITNPYTSDSGSLPGTSFNQNLTRGVCDGFRNSLNRTFASNSSSPHLNVEIGPSRLTSVLRPDAAAAAADFQPTIFQKRVSRRAVSSSGGSISPTVKAHPQLVTSASNGSSVHMPDEESPNIKHQSKEKRATSPVSKVDERSAQPSGSDEMGEGLDGDQDDGKDDDDMDDSGDVSGVLYETDEATGLDAVGHGMLPAEKGKGKKGLPAKNLMAERRRRKKLNDRLYTLRSVVPKITKMDRASILGDAIEYLKELVQKIHVLHSELDTNPAVEKPPPLSPSTPLPVQITSALAYRVKEEPASSLPDPTPTTVEVSSKEEGKALNIHMLCARKPGLLISVMRALDGLGFEVEQGVVSCFNGFALDIFRAEQLKGMDVTPEEIREALLTTAGASPSDLM